MAGITCASLLAGAVVAVKDGVVDLGPKLFEDVEDAVNGNLGEPLLAGFGPGAFFSGVVKIGNAGASAVANSFREIEAWPAGVVLVMRRRKTA